MQLSKAGYYAEIAVYPPLILASAAAAWGGPHPAFHLRGLVGEFVEISMGVAIWTLIEYLMHRLLHSLPPIKRMHDMHHASPAAFVGTPVWVSLTGFTFGALLPLWWLAGLHAAGGVTAGLMLGYVWYLVVHDAVHRWPLDKSSLCYAAKMRHVRHHLGGAEGNFGVTVAIWDHLLGTFIDPSTRTRRPWRGSEVRS